MSDKQTAAMLDKKLEEKTAHVKLWRLIVERSITTFFAGGIQVYGMKKKSS